MKTRFNAILLTKDGDAQKAEQVELGLSDLMEGDVTVAVSHSTVNYKDGLALTGRSPVVRKFPMIPGIDLAGTVEESSHPDFESGDKVVESGETKQVLQHPQDDYTVALLDAVATPTVTP